MMENGGGRRGDDLVKGMGSMRAVEWSVRGKSRSFPSRHLVDTRGPNSHEIQQKMAVPNAKHHER